MLVSRMLYLLRVLFFKNLVKIIFLSTSRGVMVDRTARTMKLGGELLFVIW